MDLQTAKNTDVYIIANDYVEEVNLYEFIMESDDETTSPRGVEPRLFYEEIDVEEDDRMWLEDESRYSNDEDNFRGVFYEIFTWGCCGNNRKSLGVCFKEEKNAQNYLFQHTYNRFLNDDQRNTLYFEDKDVAERELWELRADNMGINIDVAKSIYKKKECVEKIRAEKEITIRNKETERINRLINCYSEIIEPKQESFKETCRRLSDAIGERIESRVFYGAVKNIRKKFKQQYNEK